MKCEYCRRLVTSRSETCAGCGAPSKVNEPAIMYDPRLFNAQDLQLLGRPGASIPINLAACQRISDVVWGGYYFPTYPNGR